MTEALRGLFSELGVDFTRLETKKNVIKCIYIGGKASFDISGFQKHLRGLASTNEVELSEELSDILKSTNLGDFRSALRAMQDDEDGASQEAELPESFRGLVLYRDPHDHSEMPFYLVNEDLNEVSEISARQYVMALGARGPELIATSKSAVRIYAPQKPKGVFKKDSTDFFNTFRPPKWRSFNSEDLPDEIPSEIEAFVNHLLPLPIEREFLYHWLRGSITTRAATYLILCGVGGIGKTTLKEIFRAIHGSHNMTSGKESQLVSTFNSQLEGSTGLFFDELKWGANAEKKLKEFQNNIVAIERKGLDPKQVEVTASTIISNNHAEDNHILYDGRKFVPIALTHVKLLDVWSHERIGKFISRLQEDVEYVAQFGYWLLKHGDRSKRWPTFEYKGPDFYRLAAENAPDYVKRAIEVILLGPVRPENAQTPEHKRIIVPGKGYIWSRLNAERGKKQGDVGYSRFAVNFVKMQNQLAMVCDEQGRPRFHITRIPGSALMDFYVEVIDYSTLENVRDEDLL